MSSFSPGDTLVFDPKTFNTEYWEGLSENDRIKYYGDLGYGSDKLVLFTYLCEHNPQAGHCVLVNMDNQKIETMRHTNNFRLATALEC